MASCAARASISARRRRTTSRTTSAGTPTPRRRSGCPSARARSRRSSGATGCARWRKGSARSTGRSRRARRTSARKSAESPDSVNWAIHVDDAHVGFTGIEHIDWISRQGESYIFVGQHRLYRKGVASEAIRLRTDYAFRELNLHRIYNWAAHENVGSRRANEKAGYRQRVLVPEVMRRGARYLDAWGGDILRSDWEARGGQPDR